VTKKKNRHDSILSWEEEEVEEGGPRQRRHQAPDEPEKVTMLTQVNTERGTGCNQVFPPRRGGKTNMSKSLSDEKGFNIKKPVRATKGAGKKPGEVRGTQIPEKTTLNGASKRSGRGRFSVRKQPQRKESRNCRANGLFT